jgi:MFS family permease
VWFETCYKRGVTVTHSTGMFASLQYPGTRRYFGGLIVSMLGSWMQSIAMAWLIVEALKGGGLELGLQQVFQFVPMLILGAWAGSLADRIDKRKLMLVTQTILGMAALAIAALDFAGRATLAAVLVVSAVSGLAGAFDTPVRRALIGDLVPQAVVPNAMALNTGVITSSRVVGMAIGGVIINIGGTKWCFLLNGISYLAMLFALNGLDSREHRSAPPAAGKGGVKLALRHIVKSPVLLAAMGATTLIATFTFNFALTLPLLIKKEFGLEANSLGLVMAFVSVGSFAGALLSAKRSVPTLWLLLVGGATMGFGNLGVALSRGLAVCCLACIAMGLGGGLLMSQLSGLLTALSPGSMRGRVLALQSVIFIGSTPIGGPIIGLIAKSAGTRWAIATGGLAAIIAVSCALPTVLRTAHPVT